MIIKATNELTSPCVDTLLDIMTHIILIENCQSSIHSFSYLKVYIHF